MSFFKPLFVASFASFTLMITSMSSFSRWGSYRLWEPAATAPRQLVPTSRRGCTTTSAAPTARRSSHCSRTPSSATATPLPSNESVLQQPSHLQYCCKGNFPDSTTEKSESVHPFFFDITKFANDFCKSYNF